MSEEILLQAIRINRINKVKDIFESASDPLLFNKIAKTGALFWNQSSSEFVLQQSDSFSRNETSFISQVNNDLSINGLSDEFDLINRIYTNVTGMSLRLITQAQTIEQAQTTTTPVTQPRTTTPTRTATTTRATTTSGGGRSGY